MLPAGLKQHINGSTIAQDILLVMVETGKSVKTRDLRELTIGNKNDILKELMRLDQYDILEKTYHTNGYEWGLKVSFVDTIAEYVNEVKA